MFSLNFRSKNNWSAERLDQLTTLWKEGKSGTEIATIFGHGFTRSAVLAKARLLNLPRRRDASGLKPRTETKPKSLPRIRLSGPINQLRTAVTKPLPAPKPSTVVPRLIALVDLEKTDCRWPYGDSPVLFCGCKRELGRPYCAGHIKASLPAHFVAQ